MHRMEGALIAVIILALLAGIQFICGFSGKKRAAFFVPALLIAGTVYLAAAGHIDYSTNSVVILLFLNFCPFAFYLIGKDQKMKLEKKKMMKQGGSGK